MAGIRHYTKKKDEKEAAETENEKKDEASESKQANESKSKKRRNGNGGGGGNSGDTQFKEFYLNEKFESVTQALTIFKDDELLSKPGEWLLLD